MKQRCLMAEKKKTIIEKPNAFILGLALTIVRPILKFKYKTTFDRSGLSDMEGPALVLCPHTSNMDFILTAAALWPHRPTFVVSEHFMAKPLIRKLLNLMHVIPKKMFCPDIKTIMNIIRAKDSGNVIVLYPEGRLPSVGHSVQVTDGTADLVKKLAVNVYIVTGNGATKTLPKWSKSGMRSGKIHVDSYKLFDGKDIKGLTVPEIQEALDKAIFHDEDLLFNDVAYKSKAPALGLDGVLYKCPECGAEFEMVSSDRHISCTKCGFKAELDNYYKFHGAPFTGINQWYAWQEEQLDLDTPLESETILAVPGEDGNMDRNAGYGKIYMDREIIRFEGTCFGEDFSFEEKPSDIKAFPMSVGDHFDIYHKKKMYNFILQPDPRQVVKWVLYMDKLMKE